jgi:hypothetical protein
MAAPFSPDEGLYAKCPTPVRAEIMVEVTARDYLVLGAYIQAFANL